MAELGRPSRKKEGERERGCGLKGGERKVGRQVVAQVGFEKKKDLPFFMDQNQSLNSNLYSFRKPRGAHQDQLLHFNILSKSLRIYFITHLLATFLSMLFDFYFYLKFGLSH